MRAEVESIIESTIKRYLRCISIGCCVIAAACSHAPTKTESAQAAPTPVAEQSATTLEQQTVQAGESNEITDPFGLKDTAEPPEPKTAEEAVAIAVAEQNLLDRIRAGFAMTDADRVAIDREVAWFARHDDYLDRTFRRAERYLYFIVGELEERKMPLELALLPIVESAFNPVAQSRARAAGLWQFIPSTGRRFGLEQNRQYDGRRDVMESTRAALAYLQFLATEFDGDWQLAVAAYNCGELNVSRAIKRNQARGKPIDFFSLDLPRETRAYVPKLLAMRRIVAQPEKYGIAFVRDIANKQYFAKVEVDEPIDLGVAARLAGMSLEDLIVLNPAYRRAVTTADGPGYILVPTAHEEQLRSALSELQSPDQRVPKSRYTVNRGDTVASVARKLGVKPDELIATNKIKNNTLRVGQELVVIRGSVSTRVAEVDQSTGERFVTRDPSYVPPPLPPPEKRSRSSDAGGRYTVHSGETLWSIARDHGVSVEALAMENKLNSKSHIVKGQKLWIPPISFEGANTLASTNLNSDSVEKITYVVRGGDTLAKIAKAFRVEMKDLLTWNKLKSNDVIKVGQKLVMYVIDMRRSGG